MRITSRAPQTNDHQNWLTHQGKKKEIYFQHKSKLFFRCSQSFISIDYQHEEEVKIDTVSNLIEEPK